MIPIYTRTIKSLLLLLALLAGIWFQTLNAQQQPAFPGAEGAGMYTTGGRGTTASPTTVFEVTNLGDDGLQGSLRYALTASATYRTVIFRVSGTIHLNSKLNIRANTTIAGQTAPGDGICVADYPVVISGDNVIVRYMRFRMGDKNQNKGMVDGSGGDDAFGGLGVSNIMIDHCSVSWSDDEALTIYRGDNLTIQWCFMSEPLNYSYHFETGDADYEHHGYNGIQGSKHGTIHHNLYAHAKNRNPRFAGISTYTPNTPGVENVDFRNNVIYNWGINTVYGGEGGNYNVVNNYYKYGPSTSSGVRYRIANPGYTVVNGVVTIPYGKWYINGNYVFGSTTNTNNNWSGVVMQSNVAADTVQSKVTTPFDLGYTVTTESATAAYESVLQGAGCTLPNRDTLDQRIVLNVRNQTGQIIDVQGGYPHGTPYASTVNAWPTLNSTAAPTDTDHDGMPDSWESSNGLNPNDPSDKNSVAANGYTNLENYLNSLISTAVNTSPTIISSASLNNFTQTLGTPSAAQTFTVSGINLATDITLSAPTNYQLSLDGSTWSSSLTLPQSAGNVANTSVNVRLNATANGNYNGSISGSSTGATTIRINVSGTTSTANSVTPSLKQIIGIYPVMDGGFESQIPGSVSNAAPSVTSSVVSNGYTSVWTTTGAANIINNGTARTGSNYFTYTSTSTSTKNNFAPAVAGAQITFGTKYIVQYYYRADAPATGNAVSGLLATTDSMANLSTGYSTVAWQATNSAWQKSAISYSVNTPVSPYTIKYGFGGFRFNGGGNPIAKFDVDDFVVYPADDQSNPTPDVTAPASVQNAAANGSAASGSISINWDAPTTGVDGGGYVVVRSTSPTTPAPNANGIYTIGGSMGVGNTIVYIGPGISFEDNGNIAPLANGATYYYYIFTVDKAFNYSTPVSVTGTLTAATPVVSVAGNVGGFTQLVGSPSLSKSFSVSGANLTGDLNITAPAGYEVSEDDNTWSTVLGISPVGGSVQTTVFVRLNVTTAGTYNGAIQVSSAGAANTSLAVTGTATIPASVPAGIDVVVAKDGSGNYTSVQAAINAAPTGRTSPYRIYIRKGKYVETVNIPSNKPFIQLQGESLSETIISYDNYSGKANPAGGTYGTSTCATMIISAPDVMVMNLSVENATAYGINANALVPAPGDGPQAVAVYTTSDRVVFYNVRMNGGQDTYYGGNVEGTRVYFKNSYIDGNTDFLFGSSTIIFDTCIIYPRTRLDNQAGGYVTAVNTKQKSGYGYVFRDCKITKNRGTTLYTLGRPWQNDGGTADASKSYNKVAFLNTKMGSSITAPGWSTWDAGTNTGFITFGEYNSRKYDGTPVDISGRVAWSKQFTSAEAAKYYNNDTVYINANTPVMAKWDPYATWTELSKPFTPELAVSNLIGKKGTAASTINWNLSWPMQGVTLDLYRSTDKVNYTLVNSQLSAEDTAGNFTYSDALPAAGQTYYYIVRASKAGFTSITSDTALVSSVPTITATGSFINFKQGGGIPSDPQSYIVSGVNLLGDVTITPPAGYEVSANGGTNWYSSSNPLSLSPTNNTLANTTILVRLNATGVGSYNGNIVHTSTLATSVNLAVTGTAQTDPLPVSIVLQQWPLTANNQDDAAVRSAGVTPSASTLYNFSLSDGITSSTYPAYSAINGQAFSASSNGNGSWSIGGTPNRAYYEQFTITANTGYALRVDSLLMSTAFLSTANGRLAVSYSVTNFVSDSTTTIPAATPSAPLVINNQNIGYSNVGLALGAAGIDLQPGQTLTVRLYYAAGTTSTARYALLNNVRFKGLATAIPGITTSGTLTTFTQSVGAPSAVQTYTVSGSSLTGNVSITPPAGYEVSANGGTTWYTATTPLVLTPASGTINNTISVRLNAAAVGNYSGSIAHVSTGATTVNLPVTGSTVSSPQITVSGSLNNFLQTVGAPSTTQTYTVNGTALTGNITITPAANYEVSGDGGTTWNNSTSPLTLVQSNGLVASTTITVRLNATAAGTYSGNIIHASSGATSVNKVVSGTTVPAPAVIVTGTLNAFTHTAGTPSAVQTYTVSGSNLTGAITITAPANYQVSNGGTTWGSTVTLMPTNGVVGNTTISVRLNASTAGVYSGNITNATNGGSTVNVAVTGTTIPAPSITTAGTLTGFAQNLGTPSAAKTYTVSGANLTGNIIMTAPAGYELSTDGTTWTTNAVTISQTGGTVNTTTISVRLNASAIGSYNGNITHTSAGATTVNVAVSGTTVLPPTLAVNQALTPFAQVYGTPSDVQTYTITGANLVGNVTITPPNRYELSPNGGVNWTAATLNLVPVNGTVNATISVRLNGVVPGAYNGTISHSTPGLTAVTIPVSGFTKVNAIYGIYPVPTYRTAFVVHPAMTTQREMHVYTIFGQKIASYTIAPGTTETPVDVSQMPQGAYMVVIYRGAEKTVLRFIKK